MPTLGGNGIFWGEIRLSGGEHGSLGRKQLLWGETRGFLMGEHGSLGGTYGWGMLGVPLKPQLALGMCENKGEAQSPLA